MIFFNKTLSACDNVHQTLFVLKETLFTHFFTLISHDEKDTCDTLGIALVVH